MVVQRCVCDVVLHATGAGVVRRCAAVAFEDYLSCLFLGSELAVFFYDVSGSRCFSKLVVGLIV